MSKKKKGGNRLNQKPKRRRRRGALIALLLLVVLIVALVAAAKAWIKAPELPSGGKGTNVTQTAAPSEEPQNTEAPVEETQGQENLSVEGRKDGYYTILVYGQDTTSGNTDTMILVTLDTINTTCSMMSLPRDTMVNVDRSGAAKKLNHVYQSDGYEALAQKVAETTGVYPDFYVKIEWEAVGTLVDAIGGVTFDVPYDMDYEDPTPGQELYIHLKAGEQVLDGEHAMQLVRWRKNNMGEEISVGDTGRMEITQSFLKAVAKQTLQPQNLANLNKLLEIFNENVETDLSLGNLLWFANAMQSIDLEYDMYSCTLPADMNGSYNKISFVFPYPDQIVEEVNAHFNPYTQEIRESDLSVMGVDSNGTLTVTNGILLSD